MKKIIFMLCLAFKKESGEVNDCSEYSRTNNFFTDRLGY